MPPPGFSKQNFQGGANVPLFFFYVPQIGKKEVLFLRQAVHGYVKEITSMRFKIKMFIPVSFCLLVCMEFFGCASRQPSRVSLDQASRKFLDVVGYIILPVEEKIFKEMPLEDRGEFIKEFWARRDPNSETPVNEYKEIYYSRMAVADKAFRLGKPGWKTDRGRIYVLLGPPTNVISKSMGDIPYEQQKFAQASLLDTGTLTERATEIWIYDNYIEYFSGPLRLVFVDFHNTGDYKLQTKEKITAFSMVSPTWDQTNLAKYQWVGEVIKDEKRKAAARTFDYDASVHIQGGKKGKTAAVTISIPYARLDYRKSRNGYICDLLISAEIRDERKVLLTKQEQPYLQTLSKEGLKSAFQNQAALLKNWQLDLPVESRYIYISLTDRIRHKQLRKLFQIGP